MARGWKLRGSVMDGKTLFDVVLGVAMLLGGWVMRMMWESLKELRTQDQELAEKVSQIEILVAGEYVKRSEFERSVQRIFDKLDIIDAKLSNKADR